ncbi:MAG: DNA repair protein RecN [Phycisphaeraceae bacterium]
MLLELHIRNLAVIEDARITLSPGLNVFTGETGAGKSLVIGAFEILLGLRAATDMLRHGAEQGLVSGLFQISHPDTAFTVGKILDQDMAPGDELLIVRKLFASGRTSVSINGLPATNAMVRRVGERLVDIHGQHDHQYLLKPANQLQVLDAFARCDQTRERFAARLAELRQMRRTRQELSAGSDLRRQQLELYEFQADEIDTIDPQPGEFPELQARHRVLNSIQRLQRDAGQAHAALYEADNSVTERLQIITHLLLELADLDSSLQPIAEQVRASTLSLQESAFELSRYLDRLDYDPAEAQEVEDRLNALNRLISKYGNGGLDDDPIAPVLAYRQQVGERIEQLRAEGTDLSGLDQKIQQTESELMALGSQLRTARTQAARQVIPRIEAELKTLGMTEAVFDIAFSEIDLKDAGPTGLDAIEMMIQTNPGLAMQPLRKIASGGEMSRVMLAIKSVLAGNDRISVLVFDEIDANIGGRLGTVIGGKLRALSRGKGRPGKDTTRPGRNRKSRSVKKADSTISHQVLCITHLPQIAAFADNHLRIAKSVSGHGRSRLTRTTVSPVTGKSRVEELAEMMAGKRVTDTTRKQARELLNAVE